MHEATFGTGRVALESKKVAFESPVLSLRVVLYGSECWGFTVKNMRLLQRLEPRRVHPDHVQGHSVEIVVS
jgi:hypothetical protein